ncbi:hypothetical protein BB559_000911 [Furculomyces boomerangus]|uniref:Uncharacterized protein n=2 Tax=Harpellales TaxID=61421 RepID=A0A2T9Z3M5_9FUNG|nr:hypothetical protein BB559_000911 [Furculomyces boomerangus]PVZ96805.1 hypothetical protein BB558_007284 [Smittium angustum]PVZ98308.1 hypothetical protein BB558_005686 [Smittium angustum]
MNSTETTNLITVRVIKNFEYRTIKNLVLRVNLEKMTVGDLMELCKKEINERSMFKAFRTVDYDTLKIYTHAFGHKTQNLAINLETIDFLEDKDLTLAQVGIKNETELSMFNRNAFLEYKANPSTKW